MWFVVRIFWWNELAINSLLVSVSRWNSWLESFRFHVNCIHFRGAVFVHVGQAQLCIENGVSIYMWSAVEVAWLAPWIWEQAHFWGCAGFLPEFSQTCPKRFGRLCLHIFSLKDHEDLFRDDVQIRSSCVFLQTLGAILWNQTTLDAIFARIFRHFAQIFKDFARIFNKSKLLGVLLHPASYTTG